MPSSKSDEKQYEASLSLFSPATRITQSVNRFLADADRKALAYVEMHREFLPKVLDLVETTIQNTYPDFQIPPFSCWRHLEAGGHDRWAMLAAARRFETPEEMLICAADLAVLCSVLNVDLATDWCFREPATGETWRGREGQAIAVLSMFSSGAFSAVPSEPLRADPYALITMNPDEIAAGFQLNMGSCQAEISSLLTGLKRLGETAGLQPDVFGHENDQRPGRLAAALYGRALRDDIDADHLLNAILNGFSPVWPGGAVKGNQVLGDTWEYFSSDLGAEKQDLIPFHLPALEIAYNFIEPLAWAGVEVKTLSNLPGLANLEHAALFLHCGVLSLKTPEALGAHDATIELRALSLGLLRELADLICLRFEVSTDTLPLMCIQEAGTLPAGAAVFERDPETWAKASKIFSSGNVSWLSSRAQA